MMEQQHSDNQGIDAPGDVDSQYRRFKRFELDLEFVQLLGDPGYIKHLVANGYLRQEKFIAYLKYLTYFQNPEYIIYIKYPEGLKYLKLLLQPDFVKLIETAPFQWNEHGFSPFTRQLTLEGFLHAKYMLSLKDA